MDAVEQPSLLGCALGMASVVCRGSLRKVLSSCDVDLDVLPMCGALQPGVVDSYGSAVLLYISAQSVHGRKVVYPAEVLQSPS